MSENKWIDITQPLTNDIAHWPGDTPFSFELACTKKETGSVNIGQITSSVHMGTHVDAPFHFDDNGTTIDQLDVNIYIGKAAVIDVSHVTNITPKLLEGYKWEDDVTRILLRTSLPNNPKRFPKELPVLDPAIAPFLQQKEIKLLGVDMPSVDAPDSNELATHHALHDNGIYILENIMLDHISAGHYELIALPLAIQGADGSPVRAVIRRIEK
ncbi:arylformamidase [Virgibacillus oceani]|uniref:Kynurenine formamidase n=1 Tax=Virgibacillus oceani TaxID=1479511 RepID=A0A917HCP1_9BACI|nr:arylformamidase [Virgibacillus oceani]GGG74673.1 kynurenine formamidase [Virgibacillus oceani]